MKLGSGSAILMILAVVVVLWLLTPSVKHSEKFAAGLDAVNAECINACEEACVANWPIQFRGPIGDGTYMCTRWCEQHCAGCKNLPRCFSGKQLNNYIDCKCNQSKQR